MVRKRGKTCKIQHIAAKDLVIDHGYQRDLIPARVKKIAAGMDLDALGVFVVSRRSNGKCVIIDGQHRHAALLELELGDWEVMCRVYEELSREEEAELYRQLNDTRKISAWDRFKAGLVSKDEECVGIVRVAKSAGWEVGEQTRDGMVRAVNTMQAIYRKEGGAAVLGRALADAKLAWGDNPIGVDQSILAGLALVHQTFNGELDREAFVGKLAKAKGGPAGIIGTARSFKDIRSGPIAKLCADVMIEHYNRGRRNGKLAEL